MRLLTILRSLVISFLVASVKGVKHQPTGPHETASHYQKSPTNEINIPNGCLQCHGSLSGNSIDLTEPGNPPPSHDLTSEEIKAIFSFMFSQQSLNLTMQSEATLSSNYIYTMELILPKKKDIEGNPQRQMIRKALVTVFNGGKVSPVVAEYCVQLAPRLGFCGNPKYIPFYFRPATYPEISAAIKVLIEETNRLAGDILFESFEGSLVNCSNRCLGFQMIIPYAAIISGIRDKGFRGYWFPFFQRRRPSTLNPVDFIVLVTINGTATPQTADVWYNGQLFDLLQSFRKFWLKGMVKKLHVSFPSDPHPPEVFLHIHKDLQHK
ncbi:putative amine oxidase [copper-containing] [Saccostrea cucullata]|uniref:putative amine oxidase [copper-containing] n=1 Tax=Saccostrea cuccullata TaxID=36930 RepID=UPI002ED02748